MISENTEDDAPQEFSDRPVIHADIAASFTYASYQNAIPVIRSIQLGNSTGQNLNGLALELAADPPFLRPKTWTIDRLLHGDEISVGDRKVDLDPGYLNGLNEAERGCISLQLKRGGEILAEERVDVRLLARDEWGGVDDMAQLLPAFVMPNDPAVAGPASPPIRSTSTAPGPWAYGTSRLFSTLPSVVPLPCRHRTRARSALESPFEEAVAAMLEARGWEIVPQVGISGFRVDMGVRDPDRPGTYLAGVECDGATYHSSATARDRDKVREQVLRGLGWTILRVWSTDWWFDPAGAAQRLHEALTAELENARAKRAELEAAEAAAVGTRHWDMGDEVEAAVETGIATEVEAQPDFARDTPATDPAPEPVRLMGQGEAELLLQPMPVEPEPDNRTVRYRLTDLSAIPADPQRFYDFDYRSTLKAMIDAVIEQEAPLRDDVLAQRITRAHGWARTGGRIRERVDLYLRDVDRTNESSGIFLWRKGTIVPLLEYRPHANEDARRAIGDIAIAELAWVVIANPDLLHQRDPAADLARLLGVERLAATSRARLDEAIAHARQHLEN